MPCMWRSDPCFAPPSHQQSYKSSEAAKRVLGDLQTSFPRAQLRISVAEVLPAGMLASSFLLHACIRQHNDTM